MKKNTMLIKCIYLTIYCMVRRYKSRTDENKLPKSVFLINGWKSKCLGETIVHHIS